MKYSFIQRALLAKVEQCEELRKALLDSGDKLLVHCFGGDDFYATACNHRYIQDWARSMKSNKVVIKVNAVIFQIFCVCTARFEAAIGLSEWCELPFEFSNV